MQLIAVRTYDSPLGALVLAADDAGLLGAWFEGQKHFGRAGGALLVEEGSGCPAMSGSAKLAGEAGPAVATAAESIARAHLDAARTWLDTYFTGRDSGDLPSLHFMGSPFQRAVWDELAAISYGQTTTYGAIAVALETRFGRSTSARAVGGAVGRNPVSIIVPCHRVLGANGAITGYAGGLDRKRALLALEGIDLP